jgi:NAD(P)-dependent dehydrogenase (short-subunit alcohol dehydrogenase family)
MPAIPKVPRLLLVGSAAVLGLRALRQGRRIDFHDRVVLITGGSRGLGLVLARAFAREGARLAILARDAAEVRRAEDDLRATGAQVRGFACDVRDQQQIDETIGRVVDHYGRLDVLVNDAGVIQVGPIDHMTVADFKEAMGIHFWGPLYTMLAARPHLRKAGQGRVVNIASIGGKIAVPHLVPYSASKFALVGLSDGMRAELAREGIRVTTVCPGLMRTGSPPNAFFKGNNEAEYAWFAIGDALPVTSIAVERAAQQIVDACRYGDPELTISIQAQAIARANAHFPRLTGEVMALVNRLLPGPQPGAGTARKTGWQSQSPVAPSVLTHLSDEATTENNELHGHAPLTQ